MALPTFADAPPTDDEISAGLLGMPGGAAPAPPPAPPSAPKPGDVAAPVVRWLTDKKRIESYPLLFPFELAGVEHCVVTVRRLTGAEVRAFMDRMNAEPEGRHRFPLYFVGDELMTDAAWDTLDDDDRLALEEIASDFLPARFRPATERPAS